LGSIAATLVNFSAPIDRTLNPGAPPSVNGTSFRQLDQPKTKHGFPITMISATAFTIVALAALFYSLALYLWRVDRISKRVSVNYHDWFGPSALCVGLFAAVLVSFGFRMFGWGDGIEFKG
jgi:hypothetical protein